MLKILAYFLRNMQTLGVNNSSILTIKNAEFSGYYFQTNLNIWEDFQICISVPLTAYSMSETLFKCFWCTMNMSLFNAMFLMLRFLFRCLYCQYFEQISRLDLLFTCYQFCIESRRSHRGVVYKRCSLKLSNIYRKTSVLGSLFNKFVGLQVFHYIKQRFQHRYFLPNLQKILKTPILKNICERLLL